MDSNNNPHAQGMLTGIMITLFSSAIGILCYGSVFLLAHYKGLVFGQPQNMVFTILSLLVTVVLTQVLSRQIQGNRLSMMQAFLGGWMSSLMLGMLVNFFYSIFIKLSHTPALPKGSFAQLMMLYSMLGIFISLPLSLLLKKS